MNDETLERLIGDTLRQQPLRRAPDTLESRVLSEIAQRATTPWWRMNFARWPLAAQVLFLVTSAAIVKLAIDASVWLVQRLDSAHVVTSMTSIAMSMKLLGGIAASLTHTLASPWIYGAIAILAAMYAALFGISAAAYRTLYAARPQNMTNRVATHVASIP